MEAGRGADHHRVEDAWGEALVLVSAVGVVVELQASVTRGALARFRQGGLVRPRGMLSGFLPYQVGYIPREKANVLAKGSVGAQMKRRSHKTANAGRPSFFVCDWSDVF